MSNCLSPSQSGKTPPWTCGSLRRRSMNSLRSANGGHLKRKAAKAPFADAHPIEEVVRIITRNGCSDTPLVEDQRPPSPKEVGRPTPPVGLRSQKPTGQGPVMRQSGEIVHPPGAGERPRAPEPPQRAQKPKLVLNLAREQGKVWNPRPPPRWVKTPALLRKLGALAFRFVGLRAGTTYL